MITLSLISATNVNTTLSESYKMLELLLNDTELLYALLGLLYAVAGFGFVLGRFSTKVMFSEFTFHDFKDACKQILIWLLVVYKLDKDRQKNRAIQKERKDSNKQV